ncbi:MAG: sulfatase-like hydrolase/transferase [Pirellulaceae bacterium]|nr:sulfatase-like hydrolase/transferase [Pirellulaceae bacterium]
MLRFSIVFCCLVLTAPTAEASESSESSDDRPNILWIIVEDASAHLGSYGETTVKTPHLDALAQSGIQFDNAFVTCPVCSPSRSAMVTGMYQTTLGAHQHRSQTASGKGRGGDAYLASYELPIPSIPRLFQQAGYYTCNSATGLPKAKFGKTDYNFVWNKQDYDAADWKGRAKNQPFFAQVQLRGGKKRKAQSDGISADNVRLPPYYPDHPVLKEDWADYLNAWVQVDQEVAAILNRLEREGIAAATAVFFWTDHGVSHLRGKQFLYEEGIRVPLIARMPHGAQAGERRDDLVLQIDVAATSLALAKIKVPDHIQGRDLLSADYEARPMIVSARDRCDETVELMRCVRTPRYKYIRNFMPHLPHAQPNVYKDKKSIIKTMRQLHAKGQLNQLQARPFRIPRPTEELYDLKNDPHETNNLAGERAQAETIYKLREFLFDWMASSGDLGLIPEPILEELGRTYRNKYYVLQASQNSNLLNELRQVIEAGEQQNTNRVIRGLVSSHAAVRYWAATQLGLYGVPQDAARILPLAEDKSAAVRVAATLALCRLGRTEFCGRLADELDNDNYAVGLYAIRGLELVGQHARPFLPQIEAAQDHRYEFTRRIANRLASTLHNTSP